MPKISIVMPLYNKEKYVEKAIHSIMEQTFRDFELIIVDDGSTDESLAICHKFSILDERIRIISTKNGGVSRARNIGLRAASGEYILFIDSDDYIGKHYLESFAKTEDCLVIGGITKVYLDGTSESILPQLRGEVDIEVVLKDFYHEQFKTGIYGYVASKMISLKVLREHEIVFDESMSLAEDLDFFIKVYSITKKISFINECHYYYIQSTANSLINVDDSNIDFYQQIGLQSKIKKFLISKDSFSRQDKSLYNKLVSGYVYTILLQASCFKYDEFRKKVELLKKYILKAKTNDEVKMKVIISIYNSNHLFILFILLKLKKVLVR